MLVIFILFLLIPTFFVIFDFFKLLATGKRNFLLILDIVCVILYPLFYLSFFDFGLGNDCCSDSAIFSPDHKPTIYIWIGFCILSFFYSKIREELAPPIIEVIVNGILLIGFILNLLLMYHIEEYIGLFGNLSIALIFLMTLIENQQQIIQKVTNHEFSTDSKLNEFAWRLLTAKPLVKFPILLVLCIPIILILTTFLLLFGQKPDSPIRAFTDTYRHGFSQLDHLCDNVQCGGHYLCSVAANGHPKIVKPQRLGIRNGGLIICNRQLLVANAFEELIQENLPNFHHLIRKQYNKVGNLIHRYYYHFEKKGVSDFIYLLMKPLEWLFLVVLYLFDTKPENRIESQYLGNKLRDHFEFIEDFKTVSENKN